MKKIDKAYLKAVREVDSLYKGARAAHKEATSRFLAAKARAEGLRGVSYSRQEARQKEDLQAEYEKVSDELGPLLSKIWDQFDQRVADVRDQLIATIEEANIMSADDVDVKALSLLDSGLMRTRDFQKMAEDFSENPFVLGLLKKRIGEQMEKLASPEDAAERIRMLNVSESIKAPGSDYLASFDGLIDGAVLLSGRTPDKLWRSPDTRIWNSLDKWESVTSQIFGELPGDADDE